MARGNITVDIERCKGCGLCITACPKKIVKLDESHINKKGYNPATLISEADCTGCTSCALMCPDTAITVERD